MLLSAMLHWGEILGGIALLLVILYDIFQSVVLPRPAINKLATVRYLVRGLYWIWRWAGNRMTSIPRRERWLATYGPVAVLTIFIAWGLALVLAYGMIIDGVRDEMRPVPESFGTSVYFSATTLVPLSYGDFVPEGVPARLATIAESATGVILGALAITLSCSLYESFQRREELVVTLDAFAGAPPSGVQMLETAASHGMPEELIKTFDDWKQWAAAVLESHLAYPMLVFFRSSHDNEAWLNSFGAVMDAAALVLTAVDEDEQGPARLMFTVGNHLVEDLAWYFRFTSTKDPLIERDEFDEAIARLKKAGYRTKSGEEAWISFTHHRGKYASPLIWMADRLAIVPAEWIGDRTYAPHVDGRGRTRRRLP